MAYLQGALRGDLCDVQELALVAVVDQDQKREFERDWRNFVLSMVAAHPENARRTLRLLDKEDEEGFAEEIDEVPEDYVPFQQRPGFERVVRDLSRFGVAVVDSDD